MLKEVRSFFSTWSGINFLLAALILTSVVIFNANSQLLVMVFEKSEIASLDAKVIASLNALTILYNSCSVVFSVLVWLLIRKSLIAGYGGRADAEALDDKGAIESSLTVDLVRAGGKNI